MKRLILMLSLAGNAVNAVACDKGCSVYQISPNQSTCACDEPTAIGAPVKSSDAKVPTDKMPSYQREGVHVDMPKSLIEDDEKMDQERAAADFAGKKRAGIVTGDAK